MGHIGLDGWTTYGGFEQRIKDGKVEVDEDGKVKLSPLDRLSGITQESAQQIYEQDRQSDLRGSSAYRALRAEK